MNALSNASISVLKSDGQYSFDLIDSPQDKTLRAAMSNLEKVRQSLNTSNQAAIAVTNVANVRWLTGFSGSFALAIVTPDSGILITDSRYRIQAAEECQCLPTCSYSNPTNPVDFLQEQIKRLGIRTLACDRNHMTVGTLDQWKEKLTDVELVPADDPIDELRMIKSPEEVARIRAACALTDDCLERLIDQVRPGVSERELLWAFEDMLRLHRAAVAFPPIVVSGPRGARPHGDPSDRQLVPGDFVTFDVGIRLDGYCSDITRTVVLGRASTRQREVYEHLLKAQTACIETIKPGMKCNEIDALARQILDEKGLACYFGHGLGHGLGAVVHDTGRLSPLFDQTIKVGQVWTIEPGVYIEGFGGLRIEDDIVITDSGCDVLTHFPKHLIEIPC